jgi:hypothetical protein
LSWTSILTMMSDCLLDEVCKEDQRENEDRER